MFQMLTGKMPIRANSHTFGGWYKAHHGQAPQSFQAVDPHCKIPKPLRDASDELFGEKAGESAPKCQPDFAAVGAAGTALRDGYRISQRLSSTLSRLPVTKKADARGRSS